jgi:hypothetical protein
MWLSCRESAGVSQNTRFSATPISAVKEAKTLAKPVTAVCHLRDWARVPLAEDHEQVALAGVLRVGGHV